MLLLALSALLLLLVPLQPALADNSTTSVSDTSKSNSSFSKSNSSSSSINESIDSKSDDSAEESSETLPIALPLVGCLLNSNDTILKQDRCHCAFLITRLENSPTTLKLIQPFPTQSSVLTDKVREAFM